jgi:hypothetical protein
MHERNYPLNKIRGKNTNVLIKNGARKIRVDPKIRTGS